MGFDDQKPFGQTGGRISAKYAQGQCLAMQFQFNVRILVEQQNLR
jgi:hypothetical protein